MCNRKYCTLFYRLPEVYFFASHVLLAKLIFFYFPSVMSIFAAEIPFPKFVPLCVPVSSYCTF
jgi:hypothetical protein